MSTSYYSTLEVLHLYLFMHNKDSSIYHDMVRFLITYWDEYIDECYVQDEFVKDESRVIE